jgi:Spy/CpxP family protein refolding chaperone
MKSPSYLPIKRTTVMAALVIAAPLAFAIAPAQADTDVYLFGGQSNMWTQVRDAYMARQAELTPDATIASSFFASGGRGLDSG